MDGEAVFKFKCGTALQAEKVADWLECEGWPEDLRSHMETSFGDLESLTSIVELAEPQGRQVFIRATAPSSLDMVVEVLDYAMQKWRSVPSPQGFVFGWAKEPQVDPETYRSLDMGQYDGGAVVLRRGALSEEMIGSSWLKAAIERAKYD